jgi:HEAT repeat protein
MGVKGLMGAVACCALIIWAALSIRNQLAGYEPLRVIRAGNAAERHEAALDLAHYEEIDEEVVMAALITALGDADAGVRAAAARSLGSQGYHLHYRPPKRALPPAQLKTHIDVATRALVRLLSDADPAVRAAAASGLETITGHPGSPPWGPGRLFPLGDESIGARRQAGKTTTGPSDVALPPELAAALRDSSAAVRAAAARALQSFGSHVDREIPTLFAMMQRDEADVREACAQALQAAWPSAAVVPTLLGFLKSPNRIVRCHSAQLLGRIGPEASSAIPVLISLLKEPPAPDPGYPDPAVPAARALGRMQPTPETIAALVEVMGPEKFERYAAADRGLFEFVGPPSRDVDDHAVHAHAESWRIKAAINGLADIGPPAVAAVPALFAVYSQTLEGHFLIAQKAIPEAIARIAASTEAAPGAVAVLIRTLDSDDDFFRQGAAEALVHFGKDATPAIPKLRALQQRRTFIAGVAAKSLAAIDAQSEPDAGGEQNRR